MAFQPGARIDPNTMVTNWKTGVGRSGGKWSTNSLTPRRMFNADPANAGAAWLNGVTQAQPTYEAGLANTDLTQMEANIKGPGAAAYSAAANNKAGKFTKVAPALASAIQQAVSQLPQDRSTYAARKQRMDMQADLMHAQKGKI